MATHLWTALVNGSTTAFDPLADVLNFDNGGIQAASVNVTWNTNTEVTISLSGNATAALNKTIVLTVAGGGRALTDTNVVFANGSKLLIGDNTVNVGNSGSGVFDDAGNSLTGTGGADRLMGLGGNDTLNGGAGNDNIILGNGAFAFGSDSVDGGAGTGDAIGVGNHSQNTHGSTVDFRIHQVISAQGTAVFTGIEGAFGTMRDDTFIAIDPDRVVSQHVLRDIAIVLRGFAGNDTFIGDNQLVFASEIVSYTEAPASVSVNLATGIASDGYGFTDTLIGINGVQGSAFNDVLKAGGVGAGFLTRFEFIEGFGGNDTIDGNGGPTVRATYNLSPAGVTVNLATGTASDGWGGTDTLTGIHQISGSNSGDTLIGDAADNFLEGRPGNDTIDGGGGSDMISFQSASSAVDIDLALGSSTLTGGLGTDTWTSIEDIRGGDFGDTLRGDGADNTFDPGPGADTMDGGSGTDRVRYDRSPGAVQVNLAAGTALDGFDSDTVAAGIQSYTDTLVSVENVRGSVFADTFIGDGANNVFEGWAGDDTMDGGAGSSDRADYRGSPAAVIVNLAAGTASDGWGGTDTLTNFEQARGGRFNDLLIGNASGNNFRGLEGADTIDGGAGFDFAEYFNSTAGLTVDLANPLNNTGEAAGDVFIGIEALGGSEFNDVLIGDSAINFLNGRGGADTLNGGAGFDYADYNNATTGVTADLSNPAGNTGEATGDVYSSIEAIRGSSFADTLIGDATDNFLRGGGGADTLNGGAGADTADYFQASSGITADLTDSANNTGEAAGDVYIAIERLRGGNFNDLLVGNTGRNVLRGGLGADTLDGGAGGATDIASYFDSTAGITADLNNPANNTGEAVGDVYISIEGLSGSAFNDVLTGNSGQNFLAGNGGADTLNGGAGIDYADYTAAPNAVTASLANPASNTGDAVGDTYVLIEGLVGSPFNDTLVGDANQNFLIGGAGADALNGGAGSDFADYITAGAAVTASLTDPLSNAGDAAGDTYAGIEHLRGTPFNDTLVGDAGTNFLRGLGGADVLDGRGGIDFASYVDAAAALTVDLSNPANNTGDAAGDVLIGIEGVGGSFFNDLLVGDSGSNILYSNDGADTLDGGAGLDYADYFFALTPVTASLADSAINTGVTAVGDVYIAIEALRGGAFNDTLIGNAGQNFLRGGLGADTLDGGAGSDFADYFDSTGVTADLTNPGSNTGEAAGDTYVGIEHLRGGAFNDTLSGDGGTNFLRGGGGADTLNGRGGVDYVSYADAPVGLTANLANPANNTGDAAGDVYIGIEGFGGSFFNDLLIGDSANNFLGGIDGADTLNGGAGDDFADYFSALTPVTASLADSTINTGVQAVGDVYISIEGLVGSNFNDTLIGDAGTNFLRGGLGADILNGGGGFDTAQYVNASTGVVADLSNSANNAGEAAGDTYISIEALRGGDFDDVLTGDGTGNDLRGGLGADTLNGGGGNDTAQYVNATSGVRADLSNPGTNTGEAAGDVYTSIEHLRGGDFNDTLIGDAGNNNLRGGLGADVLDGGAGIDIANYQGATARIIVSLSSPASNTGEAAGDTFISIEGLRGGAFDDDLEGNAGANVFIGGLGLDFVHYHDADSAVTADLGNAANNTGEAAGDTYDGIESLDGSDFSDVLRGDAGDNDLNGRAGADTLDGGAGVDMAEYQNSGSAITVNLDNAALNTGEAAGDTFTSIEGIIGSIFGDHLTGDDGDNVFLGVEGNDTLIGGAGNDTAIFGGLSTEYTRTKTATGWTITGQDGTDVLTGIEFAQFDDDIIALTPVPTVLLGDGANEEVGTDAPDVIDGQGGDDTLQGGAGSDKLLGGAGNDSLDGGSGNDKLAGGVGDDVLIGGAGDNLLDGGAGTADLVVLDGVASDYKVVIIDGPNTSKLFYTLTGLEPGDVVALVSSDGRINRMAGVEKLRFAGDSSEFDLTPTAFLKDVPHYLGTTYIVDTEGDGEVKGTKGDDVIEGLDGDDAKLEGLAGNDVIDGGDGADTMIGGVGNDTYVLDDIGDVVTEALNQGIDRVKTALAVMSLADKANVDQLEYTGAGNFTGTGNALANLLKGGLGNDTLDGGAGVDRMEGGAGDDTYVVTAGDVVFEGASAVLDHGGTDTVMASITYTLGTNLDNLVLTGSANVNGTGNAKANTLTGNDGNNALSGADGADTLNGGAGNDNLNGGNHNDVLVASAGNDTFTGGAGTDTLDLSAISFSFADKGIGLRIERPNTTTILITDLATLQKLTIMGAWGATGSADRGIESFVFSDRTVTLAELIVNTASPLGEAYAGGGDGDTFDASAGNDSVAGMEGNDSLSGSAGNDTLDGGDGADTMVGGVGNDTYTVDTGDAVVELAGGGTADHVKTALAEYLLADQVELLTYTGTGNFTGTGNALANVITGGAGNDTLNGLGGSDRLVGKAGDDTYVVDHSGDAVTELAGQGTDTIRTDRASLSLVALDANGAALFANVENLVYIGTGNFAGTGSAAANLITGGTGNDNLSGGAGDDTLVGGGGADTLNGGAGTDVARFTGSKGDYTYSLLQGDVVQIALGDVAGRLLGVERVVFDMGTADTDDDQTYGVLVPADAATPSATWLLYNLATHKADSLIGTASADPIDGGAGNDTIDGGAGADTLTGGLGNDVFVLDSLDDVVIELAGAANGLDTVRTALLSMSLDGKANVERLEYIGEEGFSGTGSALADVIVGGAGADTLDGGLGKDTLTGGAGADRFDFSTALSAAANVDTITDFEAGVDDIGLDSALFTGLVEGALEEGAFVSGAGRSTAADAGDRIIYNTTTGALYFDADGLGGAAAIQFATLTGSPDALSAADFSVI
jgi:Ca2+-binding RTX toxin-like protein